MSFEVKSIIDGDTIRVHPHWVFGERTGDIVKIKGYRTPSEYEQQYAIKKLTSSILKKSIELKEAQNYFSDSEAILCSVYLNGININTYFPEFKTKFGSLG